MKKIYENCVLGAVVLLTAMTVTACGGGKEDNPDGPGPAPDDKSVAVGITTEVITKAPVVLEFDDGDAMNVWAKTYGRIDAPDIVDNVKASRASGKWTLAPEVRIQQGQNAFLYAVAPFSSANTDPAAIPVNITDQVDLLYSGEYVPASFTTHNVKLNMKHALSLAMFNIVAQGYSGTGALTSLSIAGEQVFTSGTMHTGTGKITGKGKEQFTLSVSKTVDNKGWTDDLPQMWVIPFSTKGKPATLTAVIGGKTYVVGFPEVEMRTGFQYKFRLVLTDTGLVFVPAMTEEVSLNAEGDEMQPMEGYGMLSFDFSRSNFVFPYFTGDNVFGSILSGNHGAGYAIGGAMEIPDPGTKQVVVETWNSTGFELNDLQGIETIDISRY